MTTSLNAAFRLVLLVLSVCCIALLYTRRRASFASFRSGEPLQEPSIVRNSLSSSSTAAYGAVRTIFSQTLLSVSSSSSPLTSSPPPLLLPLSLSLSLSLSLPLSLSLSLPLPLPLLLSLPLPQSCAASSSSSPLQPPVAAASIVRRDTNLFACAPGTFERTEPTSARCPRARMFAMRSVARPFSKGLVIFAINVESGFAAMQSSIRVWTP
jgi:CCR4-NOT transcription complex subunit 10